MKLSWFTDIHLNFLEPATRKIFYQDIVNTDANAVLISGDIADAPTVDGHTLADEISPWQNLVQKSILFCSKQ